MPFKYLAPPTKTKRDKRGFHRFDYFGVTAPEFMRAMRTKKYSGYKVSRKGSSIAQMDLGRGPFITYSVATKIAKKKRRVI